MEEDIVDLVKHFPSKICSLHSGVRIFNVCKACWHQLYCHLLVWHTRVVLLTWYIMT